MKLRLYPLELRLSHVFRTSVVERSSQLTLIVSLTEGDSCGYGECTENAFFGARIEDILKEIEGARSLLEASSKSCSPEEMHTRLQATGLHPFALCALDEAMHDLRARQAGEKLYNYWGLQPKALPTSYTIGLDNVDQMEKKIRETPWPVYKIKLRKGDDLSTIAALREVTQSVFRVDANGAWSVEEAIEKSRVLKSLGVEFIEQPLPRETPLSSQKKLYETSSLPLVADESCEKEEDVKSCLGLFHGVNIKLTKCGGLTPARRMIAEAKAFGLKTMVGCMVESSVGISAIAHLVPLLDYVDMDGAMLLANDPATGVEVHPTGPKYSQLPGTGTTLKPKYL